MRAYTFAVGRVHEGIVTTFDKKLGRDVVLLGDENTERSRCARIGLDKHNPPENVNNIIKHVYAKRVSDKRIVLTQPIRGDNMALVRVNTGSLSGEAKVLGRWTPNKGNPQIRAQANGSLLEGPIFCDDLVALADGDSIIVYPACGGSKYELVNQFGIVKHYKDKIESKDVPAEPEAKKVDSKA